MTRAPILAALRVRQWAHFVLVPLAGLDADVPIAQTALALGRGVTIAFAVLGYGYLLNAIADRAMDRDAEKNPLSGRSHAANAHFVVLASLVAVALSLAAASGLVSVTVATGLAIVSGTIYSVGPRLKRWPFVCTALNAACFGPLLFVGLAREPITPHQWMIGAIFVGLLLQNQLFHEAEDSSEDRAGGVTTTFSRLGPTWSGALVLALGVWVAVVSVWLLRDRSLPIALALHAIPYVTVFPWSMSSRGGAPDAMKRARRLHRLCSAASGAFVFALAAP